MRRFNKQQQTVMQVSEDTLPSGSHYYYAVMMPCPLCIVYIVYCSCYHRALTTIGIYIHRYTETTEVGREGLTTLTSFTVQEDPPM